MTDQKHDEGLVIDDCWNRIGVWAHRDARSCERLTEYGHCRNCPVYKDAGRVLLQRPAQLFDVEDLAEPTLQNRTDVSYVCFRVGQEWFSLATKYVNTTINPLPVRKIPHLGSACIEGICYNNGDSLLVINLAALIPGLVAETSEEEGKKSFRRFLLMDSPIGSLALNVDEVWGTQRCAEADFKQVSVGDSEKTASLVQLRLPWQDGEISDIDAKTFHHLLRQQL